MAVEFKGVCRALTVSPEGVTLQIVLHCGPEERRQAFDLLGQPGSPVKVQCQPIEQGRYGQQARALYKSGVLVLPALLRKLGSPTDFVEWVRDQPCRISKEPVAGYSQVRAPDHWPGDLVPLFAVPLSADLHRVRRQHGDLHCLRHKPGATFSKDQQAREWFRREALETIRRWAWDRLRGALDVGSMTQASPAMVRQWFVGQGIDYCLPKGFKQ